MENVSSSVEVTSPPVETINKGASKTIIRQCYVIMALMTITAAAVWKIPRLIPSLAGEPEMRAHVPVHSGNWTAVQDPSTGVVDMNMGPDVYKMLRPDGIVWRLYHDNENENVDFVILSASHSSAFHDPTVCFTNQGQKITENVDGQLHIASLNQTIPVRVLRLRSDRDGSYMTAVYWWRAASGRNLNSPTSMQIESWVYKLLGLKGRQGHFYRIIVHESGDRQKDLKLIEKFASDLFADLKNSYPQAVGA